MTDQAAPVGSSEPENDNDPLYATDFSFAFNNSIFSDRTLTIHVVPSCPVLVLTRSLSSANCVPNRKRRRKHSSKADDGDSRHGDLLNCNLPGSVEEVARDAGEEMEMMERSSSGDDISCGNNTSSGKCYKVLRVRTIYVCSAILAGKSPFFYKLFSNGRRESNQGNVTLQIHDSEEDALMDLLSFMYSNSLSGTTPAAILDVLMAADKFEVASCIRYCSRMLRNMPMTCDIAMLYLDIPLSTLMEEAMQPVMDSAKLFLAKHYQEINKFLDEVLNLPLTGFEAVLSSDDLQMNSEDSVYEFVLKWARNHYPNIEERRDVLGSRLSRLIRFPYMTCRKLKKVLKCKDFHPHHASKVVFDALFFKANTPSRQRCIAAKDDGAAYHRFVERAYKLRPVKVVDFYLAHPRCVVYFDLKKGECASLFPSSRLSSQTIPLGEQGFFLSAHCYTEQPQNTSHCFGLFLGIKYKGSIPFTVNYEFAARSKPSEQYIVRFKGNYDFTRGKAIGYRNLFGIPWTEFMADNSQYFINGVLHIRAELSM